ncbi:MAG: hypothetical protein HOP11_08990 [Saprospiraceae bacterium]|nr:hypothetical protein [Saprospiraceae bacterium]
MAYEWDFSRLPEHEHDRTIDLWNQGRAGDLMVLHNKYELSAELYCCAVQNQMIMNWIKYGIEHGYIKRSDRE